MAEKLIPEPFVVRHYKSAALAVGSTAELCAGGYWCVVCGRYLPADEDGVIVHDDVPHPEDMTFDEEGRPQ